MHVPQERSLFPTMTVEENVRLGGEQKQVDDPEVGDLYLGMAG